MQQMIMNLDDEQQRPVVILGDGLTALLDTGAYVPVWVGSEDILVKHLGAKFIKGNVPLSGFGGVTSGNMYQVTIQVGKLTFPNMHIIANTDHRIYNTFSIYVYSNPGVVGGKCGMIVSKQAYFQITSLI